MVVVEEIEVEIVAVKAVLVVVVVVVIVARVKGRVITYHKQKSYWGDRSSRWWQRYFTMHFADNCIM